MIRELSEQEFKIIAENWRDRGCKTTTTVIYQKMDDNLKAALMLLKEKGLIKNYGVREFGLTNYGRKVAIELFGL
jgi:ABC-type nitrate/sulfonate/bicarbonate transport system substrate-binding protein